MHVSFVSETECVDERELGAGVQAQNEDKTRDEREPVLGEPKLDEATPSVSDESVYDLSYLCEHCRAEFDTLEVANAHEAVCSLKPRQAGSGKTEVAAAAAGSEITVRARTDAATRKTSPGTTEVPATTGSVSPATLLEHTCNLPQNRPLRFFRGFAPARDSSNTLLDYLFTEEFCDTIRSVHASRKVDIVCEMRGMLCAGDPRYNDLPARSRRPVNLTVPNFVGEWRMRAADPVFRTKESEGAGLGAKASTGSDFEAANAFYSSSQSRLTFKSGRNDEICGSTFYGYVPINLSEYAEDTELRDQLTEVMYTNDCAACSVAGLSASSNSPALVRDQGFVPLGNADKNKLVHHSNLKFCDLCDVAIHAECIRAFGSKQDIDRLQRLEEAERP